MTLLEAVNWHSVFFLLFGLLACGFALGVLLSSNVVRMAFYLILSLSATAALFFLAGAPFVGAMQIMIYVGGTLVLLIFGVMLTAQQAFVTMKTRGGDWVLAAVVGGSLLGLLVMHAFMVSSWAPPEEPAQVSAGAEASSVTKIGLGLLDVRVDKLSQPDEVLRGGMSGYLLPFEIVSLHLLIVLIGAAYLARAKRRVRGRAVA